MKVYSTLTGIDLKAVPERAREMEELGYDGVFNAETSHDVFLPLALAANHTSRLELATCVAVALPRSPVHLAHTAYDVQLLSEGRFILGLGSQIGTHIKKRYSAKFDRPAARMGELVLATKAILRSWQYGERLNFRGEFYRHTLMPPFFNPGPNPHGLPPIYLAAVGERMTEVAGEVADGMLIHAFTTERYLRETTLPALERGLARSGRTLRDFELFFPLFVITGMTEPERDLVQAAVRQQLAFYGSTPNYRPVLEKHGWGDLQKELNTLSQVGRWGELGNLIDDEILETFAVCGEPEEIPAKVAARYGDVVQRIGFFALHQSDPDRWSSILEAFKTSTLQPA